MHILHGLHEPVDPKTKSAPGLVLHDARIALEQLGAQAFLVQSGFRMLFLTETLSGVSAEKRSPNYAQADGLQVTYTS